MKKRSVLYYLNPRNVSAAVEQYGYTYHVKNTILVYLLVTLTSVIAGCIFKLAVPEILVVAVSGMAMIPKVIINSYKNMYEQKRFSDVNMYIEQMLYSFKKTPKIISALQDVGNIISKDSPMRCSIQEAIRYINMKLDENDRATTIRLMKVKDMILKESLEEKRAETARAIRTFGSDGDAPAEV